MNISLSRNSLKYHSSHSLQVHLLVCCAAHDNINYAAVGIILTVSRFYRRVKCNMQTRRSNESPAKEQIQCVGRDAIKLRRKKAVSSPHLLSSRCLSLKELCLFRIRITRECCIFYPYRWKIQRSLNYVACHKIKLHFNALERNASNEDVCDKRNEILFILFYSKW